MMEPSFEKLLVLLADVLSIHGREIHFASKRSLIGWKEKSVREKDKLDALALRELLANPAAFD